MNGPDRTASRTFAEESVQRLDRIEKNLEHLLEKSPPEAGIIHELFRDTHSLKSAANLLEMRAIEKMAHKLEDILTRIRSGQDQPDVDLIDILRAGFGRIAHLLKKPHLMTLVDIDGDIGVLERHLQARRPAPSKK